MIDYIYDLPLTKKYHAISCAFERTPFEHIEGYIKQSTDLSLYLVKKRDVVGKDGKDPELKVEHHLDLK